MVEGAGRIGCDCFGSGVRVFENAGCCDMKDAQAILLQERVTTLVARRAVAAIMAFAINLDRQTQISAIEIYYIRTDWMLATEFQPGPFTAQPLPELDFRQAHVLA